MNDDNITMSRGIYDDSTCMQRDRRRVAGDGSCLRRREPGHLPPHTHTRARTPHPGQLSLASLRNKSSTSLAGIKR